MQKALLWAYLQPHKALAALQDAGNFTKLMALREELKTMPFGEVWNKYLESQNIPGAGWIDKVEEYEKNIQSKRV